MRDAVGKLVAVGDVVQILPEGRPFDRCFAVVTDVRGWGITADIYIVQDVVSIRLSSSQFRWIGRAAHTVLTPGVSI